MTQQSSRRYLKSNYFTAEGSFFRNLCRNKWKFYVVSVVLVVSVQITKILNKSQQQVLCYHCQVEAQKSPQDTEKWTTLSQREIMEYTMNSSHKLLHNSLFSLELALKHWWSKRGFEVLVFPNWSKFVILTIYGLKYHESPKTQRHQPSIQLAQCIKALGEALVNLQFSTHWPSL